MKNCQLNLACLFLAIHTEKDSPSQKDSVKNNRKRLYATDNEKCAGEGKKMLSLVKVKRYAPSAPKFGMGRRGHFQIWETE